MGSFDAFQSDGSMSPFEQRITSFLQNNPQALGQNPNLASFLAQFTNGYRPGQASAQPGASNPPPNPAAAMGNAATPGSPYPPPNPAAGATGQTNNNFAALLQGLLGNGQATQPPPSQQQQGNVSGQPFLNRFGNM